MNKNYLSKLSPEFLKIVKEVGRLADQKKVSAYLVGGVVRDLILKRKNNDLDFVMEGNAVEFARELALKKGLKVTTYQQFKTATIFWQCRKVYASKTAENSYTAKKIFRPKEGIFLKKDLEVDFVTSRKETYAHSGALPQVESGHLKDDLFRRDFTVNALAFSVNAESFGRLIDCYDGVEDLKKKYIRILHDKSFIDDPTRIFRAVRFAVRLGFKIEDQTLGLLKQALKSNVLSNIKSPRLFQEFKKNLSENDLVSQIQVLDKLSILKVIHSEMKPDFKLLFAIEDYLKKDRDVRSPNQWLWAMMVLVSKIKVDQVKKLLTSMQIGKEAEKCIVESLSSKQILSALNKPLLKPSKIYMILRSFQKQTIEYFFLQAATSCQQKYLKRFLEKDAQCRIATNGNDLKRLGFSEGKKIKDVLETVLLKKIDGGIKSKTDEIKFARLLV